MSHVLPNRDAVARWLGMKPSRDLEETARLLALEARERSGAGAGLCVAGFLDDGADGEGMSGVVALERRPGGEDLLLAGRRPRRACCAGAGP